MLNICILQEIVNDLRNGLVNFHFDSTGSGADTASGFACADMNVRFPIFSIICCAPTLFLPVMIYRCLDQFQKLFSYSNL